MLEFEENQLVVIIGSDKCNIVGKIGRIVSIISPSFINISIGESLYVLAPTDIRVIGYNEIKIEIFMAPKVYHNCTDFLWEVTYLDIDKCEWYCISSGTSHTPDEAYMEAKKCYDTVEKEN